MIVSGNSVPSEQLKDSGCSTSSSRRICCRGDRVRRQGRLRKTPLKRVRDLKASLANADGFFQFARNTVRAAAKISRGAQMRRCRRGRSRHAV